MDNSKTPWLQNWSDPKRLGEGGQGHTFTVLKVGDAAFRAVIKLLKFNDNEKARARMNREVAALDSLRVAGAKVPIVYESNTSSFKDTTVPLFFAMEFINGKPLNKFVEESESIPLDTAIGITLDLCNTIKIAHGESGGILHRDIKPANIIVRDPDKSDAVIVDYGLSVNKLDPAVTGHTETIKNEFLSLPEGNVSGEDRRDKRSDLAALCAILFYLITKAYPKQLLDSAQRLPHRRTGLTLQDKLDGNPRVDWLNSFFDRGLSWNIEDRFQDVSEIIARLTSIKSGAGDRPRQSAKELAAHAATLLYRHDRRTQLDAFSKKGMPLVEALRSYTNENYNKLRLHFSLGQGQSAQTLPPFPAGADRTSLRFDAQINFDNGRDGRIVTYVICATRSECTIFRVFSRLNGQAIPGNKWQEVFSYEGTNPPDVKIIVNDFDATIGECITMFLGSLNIPF